MDSDCTYLPERLPELVRLVEQGADIATASPWHPDSVPAQGGRLRLALSRAVSRLYQLLIGRDVHTFTCLHRAYRREVVETTPLPRHRLRRGGGADAARDAARLPRPRAADAARRRAASASRSSRSAMRSSRTWASCR